MEYEKLSKGAIGCMFIATLVQVFILSGILLGVWFIFGERLPRIVKIIMLVLELLNIIYLLISPKIRYERYRYSITDDCIDIKEGFLFIERNIVPIERLHKISIKKGPIDRMFNLSKVIVTTAGGDVTIRFLEDKKSHLISNSLKDKINKIAIESKIQNRDDL